LDRNHARRRDNLSCLDVELAVVKIAFDDVALDIAFRQRAGTMRAGVVDDVELAVDVEYRQREIAALDLERGSGRYLADAAQLDLAGHGSGHGSLRHQCSPISGQ